MARALGSALRWPLTAVDEEARMHLVPLPGPAHGPVAAIDLMRDARRRKATRG